MGQGQRSDDTVMGELQDTRRTREEEGAAEHIAAVCQSVLVCMLATQSPREQVHAVQSVRPNHVREIR